MEDGLDEALRDRAIMLWKQACARLCEALRPRRDARRLVLFASCVRWLAVYVFMPTLFMCGRVSLSV